MNLFHHDGGIESQYITHFHARQGDRTAGLAWDLRDKQAREVIVFRSTQGFVDEALDPTADDRQTVVYQGTDTHVKLTETNLTNDVAYYFSVFAKGDDGHWQLQLTDTVAPNGESHWNHPGHDGDGDSLQRVIDMDIDTEVGYF